MLTLLPHMQAQGATIAGPIVNPANNHAYYLLEQDTWFASQAEAVALGGHLATINDAAENSWVYATFSTFGGLNRGLWIGLNDAATEGNFVWVSGEPVTYTNWAPGEPNATRLNEDYVHLESPAFRGPAWNDRDGNDVLVGSGRWGVVEVVPEPSALILLATGLLLMGVVSLRRRAVRVCCCHRSA